MTNRKRILIAEDDMYLRSLLDVQCQSLGVHTCSVENGEQLVTAALSYQYDIVLTDIQMPVCDGIRAVHLLRRLGYNRPVFAMSADSVAAEGFDQVLQKPVDIAFLATLLQQTPQQHIVPLQVTAELASLFYQNLQQLSQHFAEALQHDDLELMRQICHQVKGSAASFGHAGLTQLADALQQRLVTEASNNDLTEQCRHFLHFIRQTGASDENAKDSAR
ncbi:Hpt domain-containing response regulator [Rheinheimera sp. NSM]|uniref:Hpt domain-containing response regulator n=1 Tax=Rheinheimera sp. NSM TaxID=3457884 RepID=UPI0040362BED